MSKKQGSIHRDIIRTMKRAPAVMLANFLERKLPADIADRDKLAEALADHLLSGANGQFHWDDGRDGPAAKLDLEITDEEIEALVAKAKRFVKDSIPEILSDSLDKSSADLVRMLKKDWPNQKAWEEATLFDFRVRLEERWGKAFDLLRMMLAAAREIGGERLKRQQRTKRFSRDPAAQLLMKLHVRACQVVNEIIVLMENGFADGAMARWRTLHEMSVVGLLIQEFGPDLAERYVAHEHVETKRALDRFLTCHNEMGYPAPDPDHLAAVEANYRAVLDIYGEKFGQNYGWAREHLKLEKPTFRDLEKAAGKAAMSFSYQFAGYNVHATPKGISAQIGMLEEPGAQSAGATNAGFVRPAINAATAISLMTSLLFSKPWRFDDLLQLKALLRLRDAIPEELHRADKLLRRDHAAEMKRRRGAAAKRAKTRKK